MAGESNTARIAAAIALAFVLNCMAAAQDQNKNMVPMRHSPKGGALLIEVQVDGSPRVFILDTGAQNCIVDVRAVGLTLADLNSAVVKQSLPGSKTAAAVISVSLRVGSKEFSEWKVVAMDLRSMDKDFGTRVDGILVLDLLVKFKRLTLDFQHMRLELES